MAIINLTTGDDVKHDAATANTVNGLAGADQIFGDAGNDTLNGGEGDDRLYGEAGNDTVNGDAGDDYLDGGIGIDALNGGDGNDQIFSDGFDVVDGGTGDDDFLTINVVDPAVVFNFTTFNTAAGASNTLRTGVTVRNVEHLTIIAGGGNDTMGLGANGGDLNGGAGDDRLTGGAISDTLQGGLGNDYMDGGAGDDALTGDTGNDSMLGGAGLDQIYAGAGNDTVSGGDDADTISGGSEDDLLSGGNGDDIVGGDDGNDTINGDAGIDTLSGGNGDDVINGGADNDALVGEAGNDTLDGGAGTDSLAGGIGDDTYVNPTGDTVTENANEGTDTIKSDVTFTLAAIANVENLTLTGTGAINGTGNALANVITGNAGVNTLTGGDGNDTLDGGAGADILVGGLGDDVYVNPTGDTITEVANAGTDTVRSDVSYTLTAANVENLTLTGTAAINGTGSAGANVIIGNDANNVLIGGAGADTLNGAGGVDTVSYATETTAANVNLGLTGAQTVASAGSDTLISIENVIGGSANDQLTGNNLDNVLEGGLGNDTLNGGAGIDSASYAGATAAVSVSLAITTGQATGSAGTDTLTNMEGLIGSAFNDTLTGNAADNILEGGAGNDSLNGGNGFDTASYASTTAAVSVNLGITTAQNTLGAGTDTLNSMENLIGGSGNDTLIGTDAVNILDGGAGNDTLSGLGATDTLKGGLGDDFYLNAGPDTVIELADQGNDTVQSDVSAVLVANVENLILAGSASINGTGNALNNVITGNAGDNVLDGAGGTDALAGGAGDDTYVYRDGTTITEGSNAGNDTVRSGTTFSIAALGNIENITLTGTSRANATGNAANNVLIGNANVNELSGGAGNDLLNGGDGSDKLIGGTGDDTYVVTAGDTIVEAANEGTDLVQAAQTFSLIKLVNVENVTLTGAANVNATGNGLVNVLTGNNGNNVLDGQAGNDTLIGGAGNDILAGGAGTDTLRGGTGDDTYVDAAADTIVEAADEGIDTVKSSASVSLAAIANVENVILTGTLALNATGNALANMLTGNAAANTLDGGVGADRLYGAGGNDTFKVDNAGDRVFEDSKGGNDTVLAAVSYTLQNGQYVETLATTSAAGTGAINLTGNNLVQSITGNAGANVLDGMAGADTMIGLGGNDTYFVDNIGDIVAEGANLGTDLVRTSVTYALKAGQQIEGLEVANAASTTATNLTGNEFAQIIKGNAGANVIDGKGGADTMSGFAGNDSYIVDNAGDIVTEAVGQGTDTVSTSVSYALATGSSVDVLQAAVATATTAMNLTGNDLAQRINGNAGANLIDGKGGIDQMYGYEGNDTYRVDVAGDVVNEAKNGGTDTVQASVSYTLKSGAYVEFLTTTNASGTSAVNLTGNTLDQRIEGNAGANLLEGKGGADILVGGLGKDTLDVGSDASRDVIVYNSIAETKGAGRDLAIRFDFNEDKFDFTVVPTSIHTDVKVGALNEATFEADLVKAIGANELGAHQAVIFDPDGGNLNVANHTFLIVDGNGQAGYQANGDYVVELLSKTGTLDVSDFI